MPTHFRGIARTIFPLLLLITSACIVVPSEPPPDPGGGGGGSTGGSNGGGSTGSGGTSGGGASATPTGFLGQWSGSLGGTPLLLQIWGTEAQPQAAITVGGGQREALRVMGIAEGPPRALYMYRGQDDAMFALVRLSPTQWQLEMWEDGCSREVAIGSWSPTVSNTSAGVNIASTPTSTFNGSYSGALSNGLTFSLTVSVSGSTRLATGNFGLGNETLVVLGQAAGPPTALYLWRPQDHATISIQRTSTGSLVSYWESGCARTAINR